MRHPPYRDQDRYLRPRYLRHSNLGPAMFVTQAILTAAAAVTQASPAPVAPSAAPIAAVKAGRSLVGGAWTGKFLQKDWTFRFSDEDGQLRGTFVTAGRTNWQPLEAIVVSGRSVSFAIESKPKVSFALELDPAVGSMSGTVTLDGLATVPFSATRNP